MTRNATIDAIRLDGGVLCLDFVNTVPDRKDGTDRDNISSYDDLIYWARKAGVVTTAGLNALATTGAINEKKTREFLSAAHQIRSLIYSIFKPIANQHRARQADIDVFNEIAGRYFAFLSVGAAKDGYVSKWRFTDDHFFSVTAPIIKSAYDLLLSDKLKRVKECPNCGWLFLDSTRNGKRRWCSMEDCGSNVKSLEYYYRQKEQKK